MRKNELSAKDQAAIALISNISQQMMAVLQIAVKADVEVSLALLDTIKTVSAENGLNDNAAEVAVASINAQLEAYKIKHETLRIVAGAYAPAATMFAEAELTKSRTAATAGANPEGSSVGTAIKEKLESGEYATVQGVFKSEEVKVKGKDKGYTNGAHR